VGLAFNPFADYLWTQAWQIQLVFLLIAVEVVGQLSRLFNLFRLVDGGEA
jgi:hypothetical protein